MAEVCGLTVTIAIPLTVLPILLIAEKSFNSYDINRKLVTSDVPCAGLHLLHPLHLGKQNSLVESLVLPRFLVMNLPRLIVRFMQLQCEANLTLDRSFLGASDRREQLCGMTMHRSPSLSFFYLTAWVMMRVPLPVARATLAYVLVARGVKARVATVVSRTGTSPVTPPSPHRRALARTSNNLAR